MKVKPKINKIYIKQKNWENVLIQKLFLLKDKMNNAY